VTDKPGLLEHLRDLEVELHQIETRRNPARLDELLHAEFVEFARSGRTYTRSEVLQEFSSSSALEPVEAQDFELARPGPGVALLTYKSAHRSPTGALHRHSLRSSIWVETDGGWVMRFHQGTPADSQ
jgi:hypothetical protein